MPGRASVEAGLRPLSREVWKATGQICVEKGPEGES